MNGKEALAVLAIGIAVPAGIGTEIAAHEQKTARAAAVTAEACHQTYDGNGSDPVIHEDTLQCMRNGWIPHGRELSTAGLKPGYPSGILEGYIEVQESRADNFDVSLPVLTGLIGAGLAAFSFWPRSEDEETPTKEGSESEGSESEEDDSDKLDLSKS